MTSRLSLLRSRLTRLSRVRGLLRVLAAGAAIGSSLILTAFAVFAIDFMFRLGFAERLTVVLAAVIAMASSFWRYALPLVRQRESLTETALLVERRQQIDSDLVAALQFDEVSNFGSESRRLAGAVVDYVSAATPSIRVFQGGLPRELPRRLLLFAACLVGGVAVAMLAPKHAAAFWNRIRLGTSQYPTRTRIERVFVNRIAVYSAARGDGEPSDYCKAAQGRPLTFLVECSGQVPAGGTVDVVATNGNLPRGRLDLAPISASQRLTWLRDAAAQMGDLLQTSPGEISPRVKDELIALVQCDAPKAVDLLVAAERMADLQVVLDAVERAKRDFPESGDRKAVFRAEIRRLNDTLNYKIALGDAVVQPAVVQLIPLPIVQLEIIPRPPAYARAIEKRATSAEAQLVVLEGSSVDARVTCLNKALKSVWITTHEGDAGQRINFTSIDEGRREWLPVTEKLLANNVAHEIRCDLEVVDADGLSLETPIRGIIRVQADQPPSATAKVIHKVVVPTATPVVSYRANDDFGISNLTLAVEVERGGASEQSMDAAAGGRPSSADGSSKAPAPEIEVHRFDILRADRLTSSNELPLVGTFPLSLAPLKLAKGDRLKLTLEAVDYRGDDAAGERLGRAASSEGVVLEVADEAAVLAAIAEADKKSEQQLSEIIERQLSSGERK